MLHFHDEEEFEKINASDLPKGTFEYCIFKQCDFSGGDLSERIFVDCTFIECDLTNVKLLEASFQSTEFQACKLLGLRFESCKSMMFSIQLSSCRMELCTFVGMNLKNLVSLDSDIYDVDFSHADLSGASFTGSNLLRSVFEQCNLTGTDFRNTRNVVLNPEENRMTGAQFSTHGLSGLLSKYQLKISD